MLKTWLLYTPGCGFQISRGFISLKAWEIYLSVSSVFGLYKRQALREGNKPLPDAVYSQFIGLFYLFCQFA